MRVGRFVVGLLSGALLGGAGAVLIRGALGYVELRTREHSVRQTHSLQSVVTVVRDLPAGHPLTFADVAHRMIPVAVVTSSIAKPDSASYLLDQRLSVPLHAGDPVQWSFFAPPPKDLLPHERVIDSACRRALSQRGQIAKPVGDPGALRTLLVEADR